MAKLNRYLFGIIFFAPGIIIGKSITGIEVPPDPDIQLLSKATITSLRSTSAIDKAANISPLKTFSSDTLPFEVGERLEISLGWSGLNFIGFKAGTAVMEVKQGIPLKGKEVTHFYGHVLSSAAVDLIYHVENSIESFIDTQYFLPFKFMLHMNESGQKKETKVIYNQNEKSVSYWSKRLSQKWGDENQERTDPIEFGAKDMFSALYYSRTLEYKLNRPERFPIYENGKSWNVVLTPVAKEVVTVPSGVFQCFKISVVVSMDNYFKPAGDIFMWLSNDEKKFLVKFDAKVKIGSITGQLTNVRDRM